MINQDLSQEIFDIIIIGGGAAGLSAAVYTERYLMKTLVLEGPEPGGETSNAWIIENYPGIPHIEGFDLVEQMKKQAESENTVFKVESVKKISIANHCFTIITNEGNEYFSKTIVFAHGSRRRRLGLPREEELKGHGISYCVTCDAQLYKDKTVAIVGGGDASVKGANLASMHSAKIYFIVRDDKLNAEPANLEVFKTKKNIEVIYNTEVTGFLGDKMLTGVSLSRKHQGNTNLEVQGLFIEIGALPNTDLPKSIGVAVDDRGYINVDPMMKTNIDGVYAAGDITNATGSFKQDIVAAAQGAIAATSAYRDLGIHGGQACIMHARAIVHH